MTSHHRRVCPNPECGPGVFMASHFDRQYCGKCGLTYMYGPGEGPSTGGGAAAAADAPPAAAKGGKKKK